ncbi:hypothetical protein [Rhodanobacter sp. MP7CTX1]|uniref:hypothetical protein n=1 Tax=Rhodanobacter sp. MP7CTX1 TaxID=2723084 RepID=UPI001607F0A6|nr:hypothetical protein [Rhodanobacter sp. MP7CTX1]MBB6187551.1 hypothetical protein [Rhodanobacter sp. MP7CTX1]
MVSAKRNWFLVCATCLLLGGCCEQPTRPPPQVHIEDVLNAARQQFNDIQTYEIGAPASAGSAGMSCPVHLVTQPATITITLKVTGSNEVKAVVGPSIGVASLDYTYDYNRGDTNQLGITWQAKPIKVDSPLSGTWSTFTKKGGSGTWTATNTGVLPTSPGKELPPDPGISGVHDLNSALVHALRAMLDSSHAPPCVYPTALEIHQGFEVQASSQLDPSFKSIIWNANVSLANKSDAVQDFDLKVPFTSDSELLRYQ